VLLQNKLLHPDIHDVPFLQKHADILKQTTGSTILLSRQATTSHALVHEQPMLPPIPPLYPDIVIFAYCSYEEMVKRKQKRSEENNDQWDISSREEHDNIFYRYKSRLYSANKTVIEIDTSVSIEDTYRQLDEKLISKYFK
jgi:thymidylate kinase